jgi:hypothetical protein
MFSDSLEPKTSARAAPARLKGWRSEWTAPAVAAVLGVDMPSVSASQAPAADTQPQRGPHPTATSVSASRGTVPAAELSAAAGTAPAVGSTPKPADSSKAAFGGFAIVPDYAANWFAEDARMDTDRPRSGSPGIGIGNDQRINAQLLAARTV